MIDLSDSGHAASSVQLILELNPGMVPVGHLRGLNVDVAFSGWMQFLAAVEDALANSDGGASTSRLS